MSTGDKTLEPLLDIRAEIKELKHELIKREKRLAEITDHLNRVISELHQLSLIDKIIQYCREFWSMSDLSGIVKEYSENFVRRIKEELNSRKEEMDAIDKETRKSLSDLLRVAFQIKREVKKITGELTDKTETIKEEMPREPSGVQGSGLRRLYNLIDSAFELSRRILNRRKEAILSLQGEILSITRSVRNENEQIMATLKEHSITNKHQTLLVIGIPVIKVSIGGEERIAYMGRGLERYEKPINAWGSSQATRVDRWLLDQSLNTLKERRGFVYKLFVTLKVRTR